MKRAHSIFLSTLFCLISCTETFTVSPSAAEHVTLDLPLPRSVEEGGTLAFKPTADTGYTISTTVGGTCPQGTWENGTYTTGNIPSDCSVSFSATQNHYTVSVSTDSHTTVSPSTSQSVAYGITQSYTVAADTGYSVSTTVGGTCPQGSFSGSTYTTGTITGDCSVSFSSSLKTYSVTVTVGGNLTASSSSQTVNYGSAASVTLTPATNYVVNSTVGGTCPSGSFSGTTYTTAAITSNCTISFTATDSLLQSLSALWHLDGTVGNLTNGETISDSSGNANNGTATTSGSNLTYASAKFDQGLTTSNSTSKLGFGTSYGNFGTSDFSISFWLKTNYSGGTQQILNKRSVCAHQSMFNIAMSNTGRILFEVDEDGSGTNYLNIQSGTGYNDNNWHHVVAIRSTSNTAVYIDGASAATGSGSGVANISNTDTFEIGNLPCTSQPLRGTIDEVIVWTKALSSDEITRLYNATSSLNP